MTGPNLHHWRAVLVAGLKDAARGIDAGWRQSSDFRAVCHLARVNPEGVLRVFAPEGFVLPKKAA